MIMASTSEHHHKNPSGSAIVTKLAPEDEYLSNSTHLSRQQVLRRRSYHLKQLTKCYRDHYWGLMEELRIKYRDYVREFGRSAVQEGYNEEEKDNVKEEQVLDGIDEVNVEASDGNGSSNGTQCTFRGCTMKAMTLTRFCNVHILSDPRQQLYKPCDGLGDMKCGKPVLRSMVPCLCSIHLQKAQQHVMCALTKAGLNNTSTNKIAPKLHVLVTEYVREIQERRKIALRQKQKLKIDN